MTTAEAAERLGVTHGRISQLVAAGSIGVVAMVPARGHVSRMILSRADVERYARERQPRRARKAAAQAA